MYFHVFENSRKKIEPTTEMGVFVGYTETPHNYRVYFPSLRVIIVRRDVKFDDEKAMRCSLEKEFIIPPEEELLAPTEEPHAEL